MSAAADFRLDRVPARALPARDWSRHRVALVTDPRFPGGTGGAVAAEIRALAGLVDLGVVALETAMFRGRDPHPAIESACAAHGLPIEWDPPVVRADTVVLHNPSCLRFDSALALRISASQTFVVTHENLLRPGGGEGFDVAGCLGLIDRAIACGRRRLAPVSAHNRRTVETWCGGAPGPWRLAPIDWFNVVDDALRPPTPQPRDRRGRHSRPGFEKFPPLDDLARQFPPTSERCVILGGDGLLLDAEAVPPHWEVRRFAIGAAERFFEDIDFYVYFTNPAWRESFGRAIVEAIVAGKVAITDPGTAEVFGSAVIASDGSDVDAIITGMVADPRRYRAHVLAAQASLARYRPDAFRAMVRRQIEAAEADGDALV